MPGIGLIRHRPRAVGGALQLDNLRVAVKFRNIGVNMQFSETAPKSDLLFGCDLLVAEENDEIVEPCLVNSSKVSSSRG